MGDQSETPNKRPSKPEGISMAELVEALPNNSPGHSSQFYSIPSTQLQYQLSPAAYSYPQTYASANSPSAYGGGIDMSQYYNIQPGQQPIEGVQPGYQYGGQVRYRNNSGTNMVPLPQFATPIPRPMQQGQSYPMPRYQYQQAPLAQPYPQNLGRAMTFNPSYSTSPPNRTPAQFLHQSPFPMFTSPFQNAGSMFSDDNSALPTDLENTLPRGPPRKPKQSGFALWVGNLPRDVRLEEMKDFFALDGLESIFLIRKSNCAFVNYRTEDNCATALATFNDKMFQNARLVCRLRTSSPVRPAQNPAASDAADKPDDSRRLPLPTETSSITETTEAQDADTPQAPSTQRSTPLKDRYFILKSLTKEDLAWSVTNKVWATQPHNETVLNEAFRNSQNVYLIFSVNKSGEFFGYARMASEINTTPENEKVKIGDKNESYDTAESPVLLAGPKTTVTPRTNTAPRGKIFEDEVRGTVFWEIADSSEDDEADDQGDQLPKGDTKWGNPFKIEWIKWDASLQFQRTRTLRNPWNGNREIKISRDGTEIEPTVGARLLKEFDNESFNPGFAAANENIRRMSYPTASRSTMASPHVMFQATSPIPSQGWQYVPGPFTSSTSQPPVYNYTQPRPGTQSAQQFGSSSSQHPYTQQPR